MYSITGILWEYWRNFFNDVFGVIVDDQLVYV